MNEKEEQRRWIEEHYRQGLKGSQGKSGKFPHLPPSWFQPPSGSENQSPSGLSLPPQPDPPAPPPYWSSQQYNWGGYSGSSLSYTGLNQMIKNWAADYVAKNSPPEPEPIKKTGPVVGFRAWEIETDTKGPRLVSTGVDEWWQEGKDLQAKCKRQDASPHEIVPGYRCVCGFYARRSLGKVNHGYTFGARFAFGAVLLWGRLVAHYTAVPSPVVGKPPEERDLTGWRAEWARPLALLDTAIFQDNPDLPKLSERYQIPVLDRRSLLLYCSEYGEIV